MKKDYTPLVIGGGILLIYFGVIRPIMRKTGLVTTSTTRAIDKLVTDPPEKNPFKPGYYDAVRKNHPTISMKIKSSAGLEALWKQFYGGFGYLYDNEVQIEGAFIQMPSKLIVSQFANYVEKKTGKDLITYMKDGINPANPASGLNDAEIQKIMQIVNAKPEYTQ